MSYQPTPNRLKLSSLSFADWARVSLALAVAGSTFMLLFHLIAWVAGWPGPFLWFGSENRLSDILWASFGIGLSLLAFNLFAAATLRAFIHLSSLARCR